MYCENDYAIIILNQNARIISYNAASLNLIPFIEDFVGESFLTLLEMVEEKGALWYKEESSIELQGKIYKVSVEKFIGDTKCSMIVTIIPKTCIDSTSYYKNVIDTIPDAIVIVQDGEIKLANKSALAFIDNLEGSSVIDLLRDNASVANRRIHEVIESKSVGHPIDYTVYKKDGSVLVAEMTPAYIELNDQPAILSVAREITIKKTDLREAARMQKILLSKKVPNFKTLLLKTVYVPSKTVSGDFYFFNEFSENSCVGILGDVRGKGITASMKISAFEVIFREAVDCENDFYTLVNRLNDNVAKYFDEFYVAAIVFLISKEKKEITIAGAGINEFIRVDMDNKFERVLLRGPFFGMFHETKFDITTFNVESFKRLLLYSDGFEETILRREEFKEKLVVANPFDVKHEIQDVLEAELESMNGLHDDCTLLMMDLNYSGSYKTYNFSGLSDYSYEVNKVLDDISLPEFNYIIKLIIIELMTNAFKYGNQRNPELPIALRYTFYNQSIFIEVTDIGLTKKNLTIKEEITDDELMDESGRGLFIINQLSENIMVNGNTICVELLIGGSESV